MLRILSANILMLGLVLGIVPGRSEAAAATEAATEPTPATATSAVPDAASTGTAWCCLAVAQRAQRPPSRPGPTHTHTHTPPAYAPPRATWRAGSLGGAVTIQLAAELSSRDEQMVQPAAVIVANTFLSIEDMVGAVYPLLDWPLIKDYFLRMHWRCLYVSREDSAG